MTVASRKMATPLVDVLNPAELVEAVTSGWVRARRHPQLPLTIYNYTEACVYAGNWTAVTMNCRGLIVDERAQMVVARPFPKFFNHDQPGAPPLRPHAPVTVTDKVDGSMGVLYPDADGFAVATRGSFTSAQARHATALLRKRYAAFTPPDGLTVLVEIVFPDNRIVVDYHGLNNLILLGAVETSSGRTYGPEAVGNWPGPVVERLPYATLAEALAAPDRDNREGLVVHWSDTDQRVKIKYADYLRLHRLVFGLTTRTVWDILANGGDLATLTAPLPDEFHSWVHDIAAKLTGAVEEHVARIEAAYGEIVRNLPDGWGRREFAQRVLRHPDRAALFLRLDGKDYRQTLWQRVRPTGDRLSHLLEGP